MKEKASALIRFQLPSEREANVIRNALRPEIDTRLSRRSKIHLLQEGSILTLVFESKDTTALRASVNSYLSWIYLLNSIYDILNAVSKQG